MTKLYNSLFYSKPIEVENINGEILVIITDNLGRETIYSWYDIKEKNTESIYINKCLLGGFIKKVPKNVLIIGFGGGAFAKYLEDHLQNINITGIEIDKAMIEIAKKEFKVKTNNFYISDALKAIEKIIKQKKLYDLILIDVYGSNGEMPEYFQEKIFFKNIKKILLNDGTISINFSNYELENKKNVEKYNKIHSNLINYFGKYYSHILSGKNDRGNIIGIYNLNKKYNAIDFNSSYLEKVKKGIIVYDSKIIQNTILDT
ncbi:MAG: methyltransferase domain-containing protein [Candidatus Gracilibacteria bacterium]